MWEEGTKKWAHRGGYYDPPLCAECQIQNLGHPIACGSMDLAL